MVSHYKIWDGGDGNEWTVFAQAGPKLFNPTEMATLTKEGLFAFGFMNDTDVNTQPGLGAAETVVANYGASG
jgi:hypothetical protein